MLAHKMYPRERKSVARPPPFIAASAQPAQNGGLPIVPIISGVAAGYKLATAIKPATKLKKILDNSEFKKKHPTASGVFDKILSAGQAIGLGPVPQVIVVSAARKP